MAKFLAVGAIITLIPFWIFTFMWEVIFVEQNSALLNMFSFMAFFSLLTFALIAFVNNIRKETDLRIKDESMKNLREYTRNIENMAQGVRNFRHDHYNLIVGYKEYFEKNDMEGLRKYHEKYISSFRGETSSVISQRLDALQYIKTPVLKGLLIAKLLYAQQLKINVYVEIKHETEEVCGENIIDLCRIIGIFVDNAIEACIGKAEAKLSFGVAHVPDGVLFIIENTYVNLPDIKEMFEKGFSTKGEGRGIGLYIVAEIVKNKNAFSLRTKCEDGKLSQLLTLHGGNHA
jgi:two-component system sensor histidine kinase AgrC